MSDEQLRELKRHAKDSDEDRYRYRVACCRYGQPERAGLEAGDIIWVEEIESPWILGGWRAGILRIFDAGDVYAKPLDPDPNYRVKPSEWYLMRGLYLTRGDKKKLIEPAPPGWRHDEPESSSREVWATRARTD